MTRSNSVNWRVVIRYGLLGGGVALYVSVIGMVEAFFQRNLIGTYLTLGHLLLFAGAIVSGYIAARESHAAGRQMQIAAAVVGGLLVSVPNMVLVFVATAVNLRPVLVNISPTLIEILTFGQSPWLGVLVLALLNMAVGVFVALIYMAPLVAQRPLINGLAWMLGVGVFSEMTTQILQQNFGRESVRLFFSNQSALTVGSAVLVFLVAAGISYLQVARGTQIRSRMIRAAGGSPQRLRLIWLGLGVLLMLVLPWLVGRFLSQVLFLVGLYVLMGLGLNIVVGFAGLLDLGYVAFFAFGAYTMGILTTNGPLNVGGGVFNFWIALPIAVVVAVFFGLLLGFPVLRMRGDYLAITTLGFGEIIRILALSNWLAPQFGGAQGVLDVPPPSIGPLLLNSPEKMYYIVLAGALLAAFVATRLRDGRLGRQWMAMREDEDVAEAMGINLVQTKLLAFAIGAGFSGLSGAIFASRLGTIFPHSFNLLISVNVLSLIIVGGMGSIPGVVIGALILVGMPELLREFSEYRLLMYGILLIIMMLTRPEGFWPAETIKRELHGGALETAVSPQPHAGD